ncbi:MAG: ATP-binding protein [Oscillospiraceae bacterium]
MRKAITEYDMIQQGDVIALGISGGKDSVCLLAGLAKLKQFIGIEFTIKAITLDPCFGGIQTDYTLIEKLCEDLGVEYHIIRTQIGEIVFDIRKESSPCSLCARMRRGALHDAALSYGCNKIALGHHKDDAIETFIMNLFNEGRLGCFSPVSYLSRKDLTMIRPLVLTEENDIIKAVNRNKLPIVKSVCPADGVTSRQQTKQWLIDMEKQQPGIKARIFTAMKNGHISKW